MTIKQLGGVFGRNPTFNDVDVEGSLTINGSVIPSPADILVSSDIGVTVQGYDAQTAKTDTAQTFIAKQDFAFASGGNYVATFQNTTNATPYNVWIKDAGTPANGYPLLIISSGDGLSTYFRVDSGNGDISAGKNIKFLSSGLGIDFSATAGTGTSEVFSDYEEGVFTPTYSTTGTDFTSVTYDSGVTEGSYTKIGNMVNVRISMRTSAVTIGSASGTVLISGLPFTASSNKNATGCYGSLFAGDNPRVGRAVGTTVYLYYRTAANTGDIPLAPADLGTGANNNDVIISLSYQTS
jgi:hypothetical protein